MTLSNDQDLIITRKNMKIKYYGNSCFLLKSKKMKVVTNPESSGVKVNLKKLEPDIVVLSHKADVKEDSFYLVSSCGEFEVKDIFVYGYKSEIDKECETADVYMLDLEGVHLGIIDSSVKRVRERILNEMGIVNILFVSLADQAEMKLTKLTDLVGRIEPQIVIPMDYTKENLEKFTKVLGVKEPETLDSLGAKRSDFLEEDMPIRVVVLKR
jgi:L-ascorbate metabolism protein UlaG (beta-lactamase superfamily)